MFLVQKEYSSSNLKFVVLIYDVITVQCYDDDHPDGKQHGILIHY